MYPLPFSWIVFLIGAGANSNIWDNAADVLPLSLEAYNQFGVCCLWEDGGNCCQLVDTKQQCQESHKFLIIFLVFAFGVCHQFSYAKASNQWV